MTLSELIIKTEACISNLHDFIASGHQSDTATKNAEIDVYFLKHYFNELNRTSETDNHKTNDIEVLKRLITTELAKLKDCFYIFHLSHQDALDKAVETKNLELMEIALANGADINKKDFLGNPLLIKAASKANIACLKRVLAIKEVNLDSQTTIGDTALIYLCRYTRPSKLTTELFTLLIQAGADPNLANNIEHTPLIEAIRNEHFEIVKLLLAIEGLNIATRNNFHGPLKEAIVIGHSETVSSLLQKKAELPRNALILACYGGFVDIAKLIVNQHPPSTKKLNQALIGATEEGQFAAVEYLLTFSDIDVNTSKNTSPQNMPLVKAIEEGHTQIAQLLIAHGADKAAAQKQLTCTNLGFAAALGDIEEVRRLVQSEPINAQDSKGYTALSRAVIARQPAIVKLLIEAGADVNISRHYCNRTPLLDALEYPDDAVVSELLKVPDINLDANDSGRIGTAKTIATQHRLTSIVTLITQLEQQRLNQQRDQQEIKHLLDALDGYKTNRAADPNEYFAFFKGLFGGYSRTDKLKVVEKITNRLTATGLQEKITADDLNVFRQGNREQSLANTIAKWEQNSGQSFDQLVNRLNQSLPLANQQSKPNGL